LKYELSYLNKNIWNESKKNSFQNKKFQNWNMNWFQVDVTCLKFQLKFQKKLGVMGMNGIVLKNKERWEGCWKYRNQNEGSFLKNNITKGWKVTTKASW